MNIPFNFSTLKIAATVLVLSGCETTLDDLIEVRTVNNKGQVTAINGKPVQQTDTQPNTQQTLVVEKQEQPAIRNDASIRVKEQAPLYNEFTFIGEYEINVDLAARAIQRQFNFQSPEQIKRRNGALAADFMIRDNAYRWDVSPGSYYNFRRAFAINGLGYNIDLEIVRLGDKKTNVIATYWVKNDNQHNRSDVNDYIRSNLRTALNRYL